ncbi:MAG: type II toxin-antitoxin system YafQ family toxin [Taibaiella sp.]|nr:type II toxin-antitoxin system YafQ family toxin [Taibaiella sp.]
MEISFSDQFKKTYHKNVHAGKVSADSFRAILALFTANPFDAKLKTHKLSGKLKGLWSCSLAYNLRIVFYFTQDKPPKAVFINIGDHDEAY